jgi:hypothetical protein
MNISKISSKNNKKSTSFQKLVILLHFHKVLTLKGHSKLFKKASPLRVFDKILTKLFFGN